MDLRGLFLGSKLKIAIVAIALLVASVGGAYALGVIGAPAVTGVDNEFGPVTQERTYVLTDMRVQNPNPIGIQLGGTKVTYTVEMNEVRMANGTKSGLQVDSGNSTLEFNTTMFNDRIPPWWTSHVQHGEVTNVTVDATVRTSVLGEREFDVTEEKQVETDIIGQFNSTETRPVKRPDSDEVVLYVNRTNASWGEVTSERTPMDMTFVVYNPSSLQPYAVTKVGYNITMNGVPVGSGETEQVATVIEPKTRETLRPTTVIRNERLDDWWVTHLRRDQVTDLRIDFYAVVEVAGTEFRVPMRELTYEKEIETDIFGNKNGTDGSGAGGSGTPTPTASDETDGRGSGDGSDGDGSGDGGESPTSSPTDSPTPTPSPTGTDDGGVLGAAGDGPAGGRPAPSHPTGLW
jgi:LEA14-like dessication related protein